MQDGQTPLQLAINKNSYKVVYLLIAECNQQIFHLSQVSNMNAFLLMPVKILTAQLVTLIFQ